MPATSALLAISICVAANALLTSGIRDFSGPRQLLDADRLDTTAEALLASTIDDFVLSDAQFDVILPPNQDGDINQQNLPEVLLIIMPGAFLGPRDFLQLAQTIQQQATAVKLWVALGAINTTRLFEIQNSVALSQQATQVSNWYEAVLEAALQRVQGRAIDAGFPCQPAPGTDSGLLPAIGSGGNSSHAGTKSGDGHQPPPQTTAADPFAATFNNNANGITCSNVYLLAQSASGTGLTDAAFKYAAGYILLAATPVGLAQAEKQYLDVSKWASKPLMVLQGDSDGQMRWFVNAQYAAQSVATALKFGADYAAARQPVVLLPGVNHAQVMHSWLLKLFCHAKPLPRMVTAQR